MLREISASVAAVVCHICDRVKGSKYPACRHASTHVALTTSNWPSLMMLSRRGFLRLPATAHHVRCVSSAAQLWTISAPALKSAASSSCFVRSDVPLMT